MNKAPVSRPLLVAETQGFSLRYFASPLYVAHRQADMPWHAVDDLWPHVMNGDNSLATDFKRQLRRDWDQPSTIATPQGIVTIAPHYMAQILLELTGTDKNRLSDGSATLGGWYRRNLTEAMKLMVPHLSPVERMLYGLAAMDGPQVPA